MPTTTAQSRGAPAGFGSAARTGATFRDVSAIETIKTRGDRLMAMDSASKADRRNNVGRGRHALRFTGRLSGVFPTPYLLPFGPARSIGNYGRRGQGMTTRNPRSLSISRPE